MRFFISSVFVIALLSSDLIAVDAKLRGVNGKVIHRKLAKSTTEGSTESSDESAESSESSTTSGSGRRNL